MSFSISVPATKKDAIAVALDALETPLTITDDKGTALFEEAKDAALRLAQTLKGEFEHVTCSISGHAYDPNGSASYTKNSVSVSVAEADAPQESVAAPTVGGTASA